MLKDVYNEINENKMSLRFLKIKKKKKKKKKKKISCQKIVLIRNFPWEISKEEKLVRGLSINF